MKYVDLKSSLKENLQNVYLIFGDDRYLCFDALKKIEERANIMLPDMNSVSFSGDSVSATEIVDSSNIYPFGDEYRVVVVKNLSLKKDEKNELKILENYISLPLKSTILILFCPEKPEIFKAMSHITPVDCNKIDSKLISAFVKNFLAKNQISSNDEAIDKLILYCLSDMSRISNELEKALAYTFESKTLTVDLIEKFVVQDKEFQIFQLAQFIAKQDAKSALELVDSFMTKSGTGMQVITPLFNNYRRALFISINKDKTSAELASALGVKEFAVKMLKSQVEIFSAKELKSIVDMIAKFDRKIKIGEIKENVAIKVIVFNILNLRRKNGK